MIVKLTKRLQGNVTKVAYLYKLPDKIQLKGTTNAKDPSITYYIIDWDDSTLNDNFKYYFKYVIDAEKLIEKLYNYQFEVFDVEKEIKSLGLELWN